MDDVKFRAVLEFSGPEAELEKMIAQLAERGVRWSPVAGTPVPTPMPRPDGGWPVDLELIAPGLVAKLTQGKPRLKWPRPCPGGILDLHLHVDDGVVFVDRGEFSELVVQVAGGLAQQLAEVADHAQTVKAIAGLSPPEASGGK